MRLTVDRLELYRAAGPLGAAIDPPAHPDSPAGLVTLVAAGRILSLIRADADVSATAVVRADVAAPGAVTVRASVLNANARHTPSGPLATKEQGRAGALWVMVGAAFDSAATFWQGARRFAGQTPGLPRRFRNISSGFQGFKRLYDQG